MSIDSQIRDLRSNLCLKEIHINTFEDVDFFLLQEHHTRMMIYVDSTPVKNYLISKINDKIINCNSSYERFCREVSKYYTQDTIFNNISLCNDIDILNIIKNTNNIILF